MRDSHNEVCIPVQSGCGLLRIIPPKYFSNKFHLSNDNGSIQIFQISLNLEVKRAVLTSDSKLVPETFETHAIVGSTSHFCSFKPVTVVAEDALDQLSTGCASRSFDTEGEFESEKFISVTEMFL